MKNSTIFIAFFFFLNNALGQIPFAPLGAKYNFVANFPVFYSTYEITEDTVILGKNCTMIDFMSGPGCNEFWGQKQYVYQDEEKVFLYDEESDAFQMIYDFDLPVDSSYRVKVCHDFWGTDSITVLVTGYNNDIQYLEIVPDNPIWIQSSEIKIGIGHKLNTLLLLAPWADSWSTLLCYETPTTGVIHVSGNICQLNAVDDMDGNNKHEIVFFPNPATAYIQFKFSPALKHNATLKLYDGIGRESKQALLLPQQQTNEILVGDLPSGIYFWNIVSEEKIMGSGKVVILK